MSRPGHSQGAHSGPQRRASWLTGRNRVYLPPAHPDGQADPGQLPLPAPGGENGAARPGPPPALADPGPAPPAGPGDSPAPARSAGKSVRAPRPAGPRGRVSGIFSRSGLLRVGGAAVILGVISAGLLGGSAPDTSAETTVQSFLLDWEQGNYQQAGQLTTGNPTAVAAALRAAYQQVDAAALYLSIEKVTQSGDTAQAQFGASVDLGADGAAWSYTGQFGLHWTGSAWKIRWSPSVIVPGLRPGTRLAVRSTMAPRALILDAAGQPLQQPSATYVAGVRPDRLASATATASGLGQITGLDSAQVLDQIDAAPQGSFLGLLTLDPRSYAQLGGRLRSVPGLIVHRAGQRLFTSIATGVVGTVGTENAPLFRQSGIAYQPGDTTGLSGLQQYYQRRLAGSPTTEVIVEDGDGHLVSVLDRWSGLPGSAVRTTLSSGAQTAANGALGSTAGAAAIVAVQASTGKILAVASQAARRGHTAQPDPLAGRYPPGQAFTIISTAALLGTGLSASDQVPCTSVNDVGGETFINDPPARGLGAQPPFSADFAHGCGTAFAGLSRRLTPAGLRGMATGFGLGASWRLPLTAFTGAMPAPADDAQLAADTIGTGNVLVSPLNMALVAGQVDSGQWHAPSLVTSPPDPAAAPIASRYQVSRQAMGTLRSLMRAAVRTGTARQADLSGQPVYGQTGQAPFSQGGKGVRAAWFVGFRGDVAFAVLELGTPRSTSAVPLAAHFLQRLPASLLGP
jgi:cell division protein FtsI/penicillin-binding protein 2